MYRENKNRWKKEDRNLVGRSAKILEETVSIPEDILLEIISKKIAGEELTGKELVTLNSLGTRKQILHETVVSRINQSKELFEKEGKTLEVTPKVILELFKKRIETLTKPPFVTIVSLEKEVKAKLIASVPTSATPAPIATTVPPEEPKKGKVLWEGKKEEERERQPMVYESKPEGRPDNILWGTPKKYNFGRDRIEPAVLAYSNCQKVWLVFSTPLEDKDLGYPRPVVIPWGKEAEFGNVFRTELPAFSQETTDGITVIRSVAHFKQEVLPEKGPVAVLFKGEEFCLIHVGDEKLRRRIEQDINHAQKETTGKNPWIVTRLGLLRSPEYRVSDEAVLEVLQTAVASAKAREEKEEQKVTVEKVEETVTENAETSVTA